MSTNGWRNKNIRNKLDGQKNWLNMIATTRGIHPDMKYIILWNDGDNVFIILVNNLTNKVNDYVGALIKHFYLQYPSSTCPMVLAHASYSLQERRPSIAPMDGTKQ